MESGLAAGQHHVVPFFHGNETAFSAECAGGPLRNCALSGFHMETGQARGDSEHPSRNLSDSTPPTMRHHLESNRLTRAPAAPQPLHVASIPHALLELETVEALTGLRKSALYDLMERGLFVRPVRVSHRCARWPAGEVQQLNQARIAGADECQLRTLVQRLHEARAGTVPLAA